MLRINFKKYFIVFLAILLLIFLHFSGALSPLESLVSRLFNPLGKRIYSFSAAWQRGNDAGLDYADLLNKVKQLEIQLNQLVAENAQLKTAEEENKVLRQDLKFLSKNQYHYVMANIISRGETVGLAAGNQNIIIDKGSADGLSPGLPIITADIYDQESKGLIIGKIVSVKNNISEICFITTQDCKLAGSLSNQAKTSGIVSGQLGLTARLEFIPQTETVNQGDLVVTSGLEQNIPRGLVIGKVTRVTKENNELWQNATVEPLVDFSNLIMVAALLP